ncbi:MAG: 1-acyl-sn-glycerol-3-phosphate acyltransferase [Saprospiraceae bacterium]|nr:1-acyl-sn-glycerol-3-phosphate acyltransferase [Saprospiraceae bacterium]
MFRYISKWIMKWWGWSFKINFSDWPTKYIVAVVPHTSSWDFPIGIFSRSIYKQDIKFIGKKSLFKPGIGWLLKAMGGYPVDRSKRSNFVQAVVDIFNSKETFKIAIAPEGTRERVTKFKTGFYYIAKEANVPIILCQFDWEHKTVVFDTPFFPTDDKEADFAHIEDFFRGVKGYYPEKSFV